MTDTREMVLELARLILSGSQFKEGPVYGRLDKWIRKNEASAGDTGVGDAPSSPIATASPPAAGATAGLSLHPMFDAGRASRDEEVQQLHDKLMDYYATRDGSMLRDLQAANKELKERVGRLQGALANPVGHVVLQPGDLDNPA